MSFLRGLLTAVAIVATVVSGGTLGIVAGALIAGSYAASQGWIGGSVGKFFNSSAGHYLTMAVGLASAATSIYSNMSSTAATSSSSTVQAANQAAEGGGAADMAAGNAALANGTAATQSVGTTVYGGSNAMAGIDGLGNISAPTVSGTAAQTMAPGSLAQYSGTLDEAGDLSKVNGLSQMQIAAGNAQNAAVAKTLGFNTNAVDVSGSASTANSASDLAGAEQQSATGLQNAQRSVNAQGSSNVATAPTGSTTSGPPPGADLSPAQMNPNAVKMTTDGAGRAIPEQSGVSGFLTKAGNMLEAHPALATMAGNALSGMAQGSAQQKMMQDQLAAAQWGNTQWRDPTQVAKLNAAAAAPINVPVGYLSRAAAVRNMMNGSTSQAAPLQGAAPAPTVAPVGMKAGAVAPVGM